MYSIVSLNFLQSNHLKSLTKATMEIKVASYDQSFEKALRKTIKIMITNLYANLYEGEKGVW